MIDVARDYRPPPVVARDSATVVLLRDGRVGLEAYFLRRQRSMVFAPGMYVFPGGGISPSDADPVTWRGPTPAAWGEQLGCTDELARRLVVGAVRELFEETGVLMATDADGETGIAPGDLADARQAIERNEIGIGRFVAERGLALRADLMGAWAHWITPEFEPRRYDTRFFVAELPHGQSVGDLPGEADRGGWVVVEAALEELSAGRMAMMPPTSHTCRSLVGHTAAGAVAAARQRQIETILPRLVVLDGDYYLDRPPLDDVV